MLFRRISNPNSRKREFSYGHTLVTLLAVCAAGFLLLPVVVLVSHTGRPELAADWRDWGAAPLVLSVTTTAVAMVVLVLAGTPLAWRVSQDPGGFFRYVEYILVIPLLMPPLVIGLLLVYLYGPYSFLGHLLAVFRLTGSNSFFAVVLAEVYEAAPYYVLAALTAFDGVDRALVHTSYSLGCPPGRTFFRVTLPLASPGLAVALSMAWARAIGAFGAVIVVAYYPHGLPVAVWVALQERGLGYALPLALVLVLVSLPLPLWTVLWRKKHALYPD
ncbi:MAG: ABC transporter permease subunit [Peptococcaceae bacterium]|jgi:molybdate/tungstate transport system permease protein|nr:ABC transporter permease subunit [Peptococcaceae bacterium]